MVFYNWGEQPQCFYYRFHQYLMTVAIYMCIIEVTLTSELVSRFMLNIHPDVNIL